MAALVMAFCLGNLAGKIEAALAVYPWYNNDADVRRTFNQKETEVYNFTTARLIAMKDHPNVTVQAVADAWLQQFLEEFGLIEVGADPATEPKFAEQRRIVKDILFEISDPANGGNAQEVWDALRTNIIIVEPTQ